MGHRKHSYVYKSDISLNDLDHHVTFLRLEFLVHLDMWVIGIVPYVKASKPTLTHSWTGLSVNGPR
jgi:hypothetical protein